MIAFTVHLRGSALFLLSAAAAIASNLACVLKKSLRSLMMVRISPILRLARSSSLIAHPISFASFCSSFFLRLCLSGLLSRLLLSLLSGLLSGFLSGFFCLFSGFLSGFLGFLSGFLRRLSRLP